MNAEKLRKNLPEIKTPKVLNMFYRDEEHYAVLAMLAKKKDTLCLWEFTAILDEAYEERNKKYRVPKTNRAELEQNLKNRNEMRIKSIEINGQCFTVSSATGTCLGDRYNIEEQLLLLYMLKQGVRLGELEQMPLDRLMINTYELEEPKELSPLEEKIENISLELSTQYFSVPIHKRLHLKTGKYDKPRKLHLNGVAESTVYIHGISFYDAWQEAETRFEDKRYVERFTPEQIAQMKQQFLDSLPGLCPEGCVLPVIEYECDKELQMQFYTTEYLKRMPEHGSTSVFLMLKPKEKMGIMGYRSRTCLLEPVKKGFEGEFFVELFFCYINIPEKRLEAVSL